MQKFYNVGHTIFVNNDNNRTTPQEWYHHTTTMIPSAPTTPTALQEDAV